MTSIAGGKQLTTLNLTHANQQPIFEKDSRKFVTINTHCGFCRYTPSALRCSHRPGDLSKDHEYDTARADCPVPALLYAKSTLALDGILAYVIDVTSSDKIVTSVYKLV